MESPAQTPTLFNYYNVYRLVIAILLLGITLSQEILLRQFRDASLFQGLAIAYVSLTCLFLVLYRFFVAVSPHQVFFNVTLDIVILHLMFYAGTGITGGLSNLLVITVAAGNIMLRGRIGLSFAALATLASMFLELERIVNLDQPTGQIARAGLTGAIYFAAAFIVQNLSQRITQTEDLAIQRQQDIVELERLNHQIIQSMRTGIIVCDELGTIKLINQAAIELLGPDSQTALPNDISERMRLWRDNPGLRTTPFQIDADKPLVQINFSRLQKSQSSDILVFVEDTRLMTQQAQQLKLASLGRLTASIAHEVRNPLGAISHATQLLAESTSLDAADRRMTDIIQRHSQRVNLIIENTLQLSRRAEPQTEDITLKSWLHEVLEHFSEQSGKIDAISLEILAPDAHARFDRSQIEQVLINLIENGLRHGCQAHPDATLTLVLGENAAGDQAYIDVIDQGSGVSEENRPHLFEPFFTTESKGTGLGLYLAREMCEANQAQLDYIESHPKGTCFRILFAHHNRIV
ncbi:MAG: ATP-binding protein [Oleiphilaceae bacterium]|nr:ATP-binding protein [Oleiphilaceae bacterium]